ncbi:MAG: DUF72 domain-containing protein [Alphaproteobacteria bacterium]|nr:DUF72 domain-containing protein [Alphaproteobacteria bacterium]
MTVRIGISGWRYDRWRGVFYPKDLRQTNELAFAARAFPTIEINGTFYSLQRPALFGAWKDQTPAGFVFALKGPRYITHMLKLRNVKPALANFFASGVLRLEQKLGPILWQLPPQLGFDADRLSAFFDLLPRDTDAAARLARSHNAKLKARAWLQSGPNRKLRHALEVRHDSFKTPQFVALLRKHRIALVCADTVEWPLLTDVTADFVYCRLHGSEQLYTSGYDASALDVWTKRIRAWASGRDAAGPRASKTLAPPRKSRDVYVYFDNDAKVRAPFDAQALMRRVEPALRSKPIAHTAAPAGPSRKDSSARR